jgi:hypothetical protein
MPISLNVNVDKVDKKRFTTGKQGRYLDLVLYETPDSDYGDYLVKQRGEKGDKMPILGNAKYYKPAARKKAPKTDASGDIAAEEPW